MGLVIAHHQGHSQAGVDEGVGLLPGWSGRMPAWPRATPERQPASPGARQSIVVGERWPGPQGRSSGGLTAGLDCPRPSPQAKEEVPRHADGGDRKELMAGHARPPEASQASKPSSKNRRNRLVPSVETQLGALPGQGGTSRWPSQELAQSLAACRMATARRPRRHPPGAEPPPRRRSSPPQRRPTGPRHWRVEWWWRPERKVLTLLHAIAGTPLPTVSGEEIACYGQGAP